MYMYLHSVFSGEYRVYEDAKCKTLLATITRQGTDEVTGWKVVMGKTATTTRTVAEARKYIEDLAGEKVKKVSSKQRKRLTQRSASRKVSPSVNNDKGGIDMTAKSKKAKAEPKQSKPRESVWGAGETPNKTALKKLATEFKNSEARKSQAALATFAAEKDLSNEALVTLADLALGVTIDTDKAATLRRAALRTLNGGAKVKRKPKAEAKPAKPAKGSKGKGGKKKAA